MPFYRDHIYPHLVCMLGDPKPIREVRQRIIPSAQGKVLEIGVGPGVNFVHYDPVRVRRVYPLEPNPGMIRLAERQRRLTKLDIEFLNLPGERIPLEDGAVDTVVSTFTLCTIPGLANTGSHLILACNAGSCWSEPIPSCVLEGCHVARDIRSLVTQSGFEIGHMEAAHLAPFPKSWSYCWRGTASPQSG